MWLTKLVICCKVVRRQLQQTAHLCWQNLPGKWSWFFKCWIHFSNWRWPLSDWGWRFSIWGWRFSHCGWGLLNCGSYSCNEKLRSNNMINQQSKSNNMINKSKNLPLRNWNQSSSSMPQLLYFKFARLLLFIVWPAVTVLANQHEH